MSSVRPLSTQTIASNNAPSPMTMKCDSRLMLNASPPRKNVYDLSHVNQYLTQIEDILQSSATPSPAIRHQHCYQNNQTFFKLIGSTLAKPMLRTLIYGNIYDNVEGIDNAKGSRKNHFEKRIREARVWLGGKKMYTFIMSSLRPAAEALDVDVRDEMVPGLLDQIASIKCAIECKSLIGEEKLPSLMNWPTKTSTLFNRLASGRRYKGNLESLICDLFPELLDKYYHASQKASEREVLECIIHSDLIDDKNLQRDGELDVNEGWEDKRDAAIIKCLDHFYPVETEQSPSLLEKHEHSKESKQSGKRLEESCITFLHNEYMDEHLNTGQRCKILKNIHVNVRRNKYFEKYVPPKIFKRGSSPKQKDGSGIIWTDSFGNGDIARYQLCSEFDAVVISCEALEASGSTNEQCNESKRCFIKSIFEAKKTISPSSLHDILEKKLGAVKALIDDHGAELEYNDCEASETIPFSSEGVRLTFGVYGGELQRPEHAADSIRSIAGSRVVTSDIHEVIRALERDEVMVEVEVMACLRILQGLKSTIEAIKDDKRVEVLLFFEEGVDFL